MNKIVEIEISDNDFEGKPNILYTGEPFTSVGFTASIYGMASPCITKEEIKDSIENAKEWIYKEGDRPIIKDLRQEIRTLDKWCK